MCAKMGHCTTGARPGNKAVRVGRAERGGDQHW